MLNRKGTIRLQILAFARLIYYNEIKLQVNSKIFSHKKMGKTFGSPSILPEGTIRVRKNGDQFIKQNGKWVYQRKIKISKPKKTRVPMNYPPIKLLNLISKQSFFIQIFIYKSHIIYFIQIILKSAH